MEMKQTYFDYKTMVNPNSMKRLIYFIHNLEEKLSSVKIIHDKLHELMSIVTKTHETIVEELTIIKTVLNETEDEEIIPIDPTKSEWDDDDDDEEEEIETRKSNKTSHRQDSLSIHRRKRLVINSATSNDSSSTIENHSNSSTSKRSSNLKKSDQTSLSRTKSPKSVTFNLDENIPNQQKLIIQNDQTFDQITTPINPLLSTHLSKQNQIEINPIIDKTLTNIRIHEIESKNGDYLRLLNISNSEDYDLTDHFLQQNISSKPICRFRFPFNTIIRAGQTITIWCGFYKDIIEQPPHVFVWKEQKKWETKPQCITILAKPNGQSIAWFRNSRRVNIDQSSDDILFVHSKSNTGSSDISSISSNSINDSRRNKRQSRLSAFNLTRNTKPPFAHSPNHPIHPDHNGTTMTIPNDLRSQMHQKGSVNQLLNRPKSSPFASHTGCKQDLISMNYLRTQQTQGQKQTTIKT